MNNETNIESEVTAVVLQAPADVPITTHQEAEHVAGANVERQEREMQGHGAIAHPDGGARGAELGEVAFEAGDVRARGRNPRAANGVDDVLLFVARQVGAGDGGYLRYLWYSRVCFGREAERYLTLTSVSFFDFSRQILK